MASQQVFRSNNVLDLRTAAGIFATCCIKTAAGAATITRGNTGTAFLDDKGQLTTSNMAVGLTDADANFFSGRCPNGEIITIFGIQIGTFEVTSADVHVASTAIVQQQILDMVTVKLNLKGQTYNLGNPSLFPSPLGCNGLNLNGGRAVASFRFPRQVPIQLKSNDQFYIEFECVKTGITLAGNDNKAMFRVTCPASRGVSLANLSGA